MTIVASYTKYVGDKSGPLTGDTVGLSRDKIRSVTQEWHSCQFVSDNSGRQKWRGWPDQGLALLFCTRNFWYIY